MSGLPPSFEALVERARAAERAGDLQGARTLYERGLYGLERHAAPDAAASLLRWVGTTYRDEGDGEAALDCYQASLAVAEQWGDTGGIAAALNCIGIIYWRWGQLDSALTYYQQSMQLAVDAGDLRLVAVVQQNMGVISNIQGDLLRALDHYRHALGVYRQLGDQQYVNHVLNNLGMLHTDLGEWANAERMFEEAATISERLSDLRTRVMVETNRTELFILQGDYTRARESCDTAFELASRLDHHLGLGEVYKSYGIIYRETRKYNLAEAHLKAAAEIAERYTNPLLAGEVQRELAQVYRSLDRNREALLALSYAHRVFTDLRARLDLADVDQRMAALEELYLQIVRKWGESIESKDRYTAGHCQRVADYACMLAEAAGFDEQTITWFRMGAILHDIGKTVVPEEILNKPGKLAPEEWELMKSHTVAGAEIVAEIDFPWDIRPIVRNHHERWDGSGYPDGLKGRSIPLSARILCVADVYDALTTTRSYRGAFSPERALEIMESDAGKIFDPELFALFRQLVREGRTAEPVTAEV